MVKIILASHGDLSKGMLNSVSMIVGELAKDIETYSLYPGENPNDYAASLKKRIEADTKDYELKGISDEFRGILSPIMMRSAFMRLNVHLEHCRRHPIDIRRYYKALDY